jgi:beta-mannosidase
MRVHSLAGAWEFRQAGTEEWFPARVPGCVHTDLLELGRIPDPFLRDNELDVAWVSDAEWEYRRRFDVPGDLRSEDKLFLVADGIDTLATVALNGEPLGSTDNQHRSWRWDVTDRVREGENTLEVRFTGPTTAARAEQARRPVTSVADQIAGAPYVRKAPCQFGWDWGPKLPSVGLWRDVRLEARSTAWLADVELRQVHADVGVAIRARVRAERWAAVPLEAVLRVAPPDGGPPLVARRGIDGEGVLEVNVERPELWWPNGYGDQPLYDVLVSLEADGETIDARSFRLGLRTIELRQEPDEWGRSFRFVVNAVPVFAKGSNWIPPDAFVHRVSDRKLERLIADAAATHQNMLRVWGGGLYGSDRFYDLCDRYGLLVWQDFSFSCSVYPLDEPDFLENLRAEVEENVRRIRHRSSLALLCGNNEMEQGWESWGWAKHEAEDELVKLARRVPALRGLIRTPGEETRLPDWESLKAAYERFFHRTLPDWLSELAPDVAYWPSSPSSNTPFRDANGHEQGDAHYWEVWHGRKPFTAFRSCVPRFMSEFGFQAFPTVKTVEAYTDPEDRNLTSRVMEHHQRGRHGNGLIVAQMTDHFRVPRRFADWIYLSLVLQAEGIRYGVEHWRRHVNRVGGTLYWQLDDCWPVASWSSIDYYGRWKALHYFARRFYAPVLLSVRDEPPRMALHLTNDLTKDWSGTVRWSLETLAGEALEADEQPVTAAPLSSAPIASLDFADRLDREARRGAVLVTELAHGDERRALAVHPFVPSKHLDLVDPAVRADARCDGDRVVVRLKARSLARFVEVTLSGAPDVVFSDNYFDLPAGRDVEIACAVPPGWTPDRAQGAIEVRSLYDTYAGTGRR